MSVTYPSSGGSGGGGGFPTPTLGDPTAFTWTWLNQNSGVIVSGNKVENIQLPSSATSVSMSARKCGTAINPAGYTITAAFTFQTQVGNGNQAVGIWIGTTADGHLCTFKMTSEGIYNRDYWSDVNTPGQGPGQTNVWSSSKIVQASMWMRIQDNGTNLIWSISTDGFNFFQIFSESRTTYLTTGANEMGFFCCTNGVSPISISLLSLVLA